MCLKVRWWSYNGRYFNPALRNYKLYIVKHRHTSEELLWISINSQPMKMFYNSGS